MDRLIECEELVKNFTIIVDWSALLHPGAETFFNSIIPLLSAEKAKLIISMIAQPDRQSQESAQKAFSLFGSLQDSDVIDLYSTKDDPPLDVLIRRTMALSRDRRPLCLIVQNPETVRSIVHTDSFPDRLQLCHISHNGELLKIDPGQAESIKARSAELKRFRLMAEPRNIGDNDARLSVKNLPAQGEAVVDGKDFCHVLAQRLNSGGEGTVYLTDTGKVCKIYHQGKLTVHKRDKISLMVANPVPQMGICWPEEIVYNRQGEFTGYLMSPAQGMKLQIAIMVGKFVMEKHFPLWTRKNLVTLARTILEKILYLHERNVIIGDINPQNILIVDDRNIFFVDTDSYQIEDFPCPVGTNNFTAPEIMGREFRSFLRSFSHEQFAVATLLFMILLPGKTPYSHEGCDDPAANIRKMHFSYPFGPKRSDRMPPGPWRYIWSHLPYKIKEAFFSTFHRSQQSQDQEGNYKRLSTKEWLNLINMYQFNLTEGYVSDELFPMELKEINAHAAMSYKKLSGERKKCISCHNDYFHSADPKKGNLEHALSSEGYCSACITTLRNKVRPIMCKMCINDFLFSEAEAIFYRILEYTEPKYCKKCRDIKREHFNN